MWGKIENYFMGKENHIDLKDIKIEAHTIDVSDVDLVRDFKLSMNKSSASASHSFEYERWEASIKKRHKEQLIKDMAVRDLILKDMGILQPDMINPKAEKPKKPERTDKQILNSKF